MINKKGSTNQCVFDNKNTNSGLQSGFSMLKEEFIKTLTSGPLRDNVSIIDEKSRDAFDRGNNLLEDIVSARNGNNEYSISLGNIPPKNIIDSWSDSFKHIINIDLSYVRREIDRFKICIPSIIGVPFESRELLKTLQEVMKRNEQSHTNIGSIRRSTVELLENISSTQVKDMNFEAYESLCSSIDLYHVVDNGSCSIGIKEILGRESDNDILSRAVELKEDFEAVSRDDTLEFNKLIKDLKQRRVKYYSEKSNYTASNRNDLNPLIDLLNNSWNSYDRLKLPTSNKDELQNIVSPFIEDVKSLKVELQKLYDGRGFFKSELKVAIKKLRQYENFISNVMNKKEYSIFDLSVIDEFCKIKKDIDSFDFSDARKIDDLSRLIQDYDSAKSSVSLAISKISGVFDKEFNEMIELYRERLNTALTISPNSDIVALQSRICNEMRYLEPVLEANLPVNDICKRDLKNLTDMYAKRKETIDKLVDKKREVLSLVDLARSERVTLERIGVNVEYNSLQRVRESLEECMKKKSTILSTIEDKQKEYELTDAKNKEYILSGELNTSSIEISPFVKNELASARREVSLLEDSCRRKMLDFRDTVQNLLTRDDKNCSNGDREVHLVLIENALLPLRLYIDFETQIDLLKKKKETVQFTQESAISNNNHQTGSPYCLESAISKIPVPDFKMRELQSVLIGDNINNYIGRMKEYISKLEKIDSSTLISSQREFFGNVSIILNSFGHSTTCANLEDGSHVMDLVFKARDRTRMLSEYDG